MFVGLSAPPTNKIMAINPEILAVYAIIMIRGPLRGYRAHAVT